MKRILRFAAVAAVIGLLATSCSKKGEEGPSPQAGSLELTRNEENAPYLVVVGQQLEIPYAAEHVGQLTCSTAEGWTIALSETDGKVTLTPSLDAEQLASAFTLTLSGVDEKGEKVSSSVEVHLLDFADPKGVFVLNEGNMTTENGSLTYISANGDIVADAYKLVNGTELGNVCQDLYIHDGKIYIISQNGGTNATGSSFRNDGMLVIADARTLKLEKGFTAEDLSALSWPTHIAVLDEQHVYIRTDSDNGGTTQQGVWRLDTTTGSLTFVENTAGAPKNRMAVMGNKVYTTRGSGIVYIVEISADSDTGRKISLPFRSQILNVNSGDNAGGIQASDDGQLWIMGSGSGKNYIHKYNLSDGSYVEKALAAVPKVAYNCPFAASGNKIYYASNTAVHCFDFDAATTEEADRQLFDVYDFDAVSGNTLYNGLGLHPVTGDLYVNSIGDYTNYATDNMIWVFSPSSTSQPQARYKGYTRFPAGFYFPAAF